MKEKWISQYRYKTAKGHVGKIIQMDTGYIVESRGRRFLVPKDEAELIRIAEEKRNRRGRPELYPAEQVEVHGITLPVITWAKIGKPYSRRIEEILCGLKQK